jgi:hypothetical protein
MASTSAGIHEGLSCARPRVVCAQRRRAYQKFDPASAPRCRCFSGTIRAAVANPTDPLDLLVGKSFGSGLIPTPIRGSAQYSFHGLCLDEAFDGSVNHHIDADRRAPSDHADPAHQTIPSNSSQHPQQPRNANRRRTSRTNRSRLADELTVQLRDLDGVPARSPSNADHEIGIHASWTPSRLRIRSPETQ